MTCARSFAKGGHEKTRRAAGWDQHASPTAILVAVGVINPRGRFRGNSIPIASSLRPEARGIKMFGSWPRGDFGRPRRHEILKVWQASGPFGARENWPS